MLHSMQPLGFSRKKLWAQALKNSQKLLKIYIKKICNSQLSHKKPPLVRDKEITYGKSLSYKKQAQTELINIITLKIVNLQAKNKFWLISNWAVLGESNHNLYSVFSPGHGLAEFPQENLRWHIKRQEDVPVGAQRHATSQMDFRTSTVK